MVLLRNRKNTFELSSYLELCPGKTNEKCPNLKMELSSRGLIIELSCIGLNIELSSIGLKIELSSSLYRNEY